MIVTRPQVPSVRPDLETTPGLNWIRPMISRRLVLIGATAIIVAAAGGFWMLRDGDKAAFQIQVVEKGDIISTISASGKLQAVGTVEVGSQVSGQISEILVDFNSPVKRGQLLARIDPSTFEAKVLQAQANLATANATLAQAKANLLEAQRDYDTKKALLDSGYYSVRAIQTAEATLMAARASVTSAQAAIRERAASLNQARIDLTRTYIRAPVDGVVIDRQVDSGQTVAASLSAPTLFVIAEDLSQMQVEANVDEADIGNVKAGQRVEFTVDAFPDATFAGEVRQVRIAGVETSNVISYTVIITAPNRDGRLLPMMTANATIYLGEIKNVLKVPMAALQFKPRDPEAEKAQVAAQSGNPLAATMGPPGMRGLRAAGGTQNQNGGQGGASSRRPDPAKMLEDLTEDLTLTRDQQSRVRAILEESLAGRPAFNSPPTDAQRAEMRQRREAMREKIKAVLTPPQATLFDEMQPVRGANGESGKAGTVYVLDARGEADERNILIGASDDDWAAVIGGRLKAGDKVIVGQSMPGED